ncbi:MAG: hypothetical protein ACI9V1_000064 [Spirosomataceae bacterium]|jgi:hypothetical protein
MKLYQNVKVIGDNSRHYCTTVDINSKNIIVEYWKVINESFVKAELLGFKKSELRKLTNTENKEFKKLVNQFIQENS